MLQAGPFTLNPARAGQNAYLRTVSSRLSGNNLQCGWPTVNGPVFTPAAIDLDGTRAICKVPDMLTGQAYVVITSSSTEIVSSKPNHIQSTPMLTDTRRPMTTPLPALPSSPSRFLTPTLASPCKVGSLDDVWLRRRCSFRVR